MKREMKWVAGSVVLAVAAGAASSCNLVLGLDTYIDCPEDPNCPSVGGSGGTGPEVCTTNGVRDGKETDVDCGGGICAACGDGKGCSVAADCVNHICTGGTCRTPGCSDGVKNGDETDADCGGACAPCGPGKGCAVDGDCVSGQCTSGACVSTCSDLAKGGNETDVDCGGDCTPCADGKGCKKDGDCQSGVCQAAVCQKNYVWGNDLAAVPTSIALDASGRPFVAGILSVAAYETTGAPLWRVDLSALTPLTKPSWRIALDSTSSVFVTGEFSSSSITVGNPPFNQAISASGVGNHVVLVKYSSMGSPQWTKVYPENASTENNFAGDVAADKDGSVFVSCSSQQTMDMGGGPLTPTGQQSMYLAKLGPDGSHLWSKALGATTFNRAHALAVDTTGNVLMAGIAYGTSADFGGGPKPANGVAVVKLDPSGAYVWDALFDVPVGPRSLYLRLGQDGSVFLAGDYQMTADFGGGPMATAGGADIFLVKLDSAGKHLWSKSFGDAQEQIVGGLAVDAAGAVTLTGTSTGTIDFGGGPLVSMGGTDLFVAKLDGAGQHVWSRQYGGFGDQSGWGVAADSSSGRTFLIGRYEVGIDLGGGALTSGSAFLAKLLLP